MECVTSSIDERKKSDKRVLGVEGTVLKTVWRFHAVVPSIRGDEYLQVLALRGALLGEVVLSMTRSSLDQQVFCCV